MVICCFFGHRDTPESVKGDLYAAIENLIVEHGVEMFYVGNQGHFDFYVRTVLRQLQPKHSFRYAVVLAYMPGKPNEYEDFSDTMLPEGIEDVHPKYAIGWRNDWMLRQSQFVVCYCRSDQHWGGTMRFVQKARQQRKTVINLCPEIPMNGADTV